MGQAVQRKSYPDRNRRQWTTGVPALDGTSGAQGVGIGMETTDVLLLLLITRRG